MSDPYTAPPVDPSIVPPLEAPAVADAPVLAPDAPVPTEPVDQIEGYDDWVKEIHRAAESS